MLFDMKKFVKKPIKGIIQVGAHYGSEYENLKLMSENIIMFEPQKKVYTQLCENLKNKSHLKIENMAMGSQIGKMHMFVESANNGQSSSLLEPSLHKYQYPSIVFNQTEEVEVNTLNNYFCSYQLNHNLLVMDVQGYELEVLKGATNILDEIDYVFCEVNRAELYKNCAMVEEIDVFLEKYNLKREHTSWDGYTWGDALYVKV